MKLQSFLIIIAAIIALGAGIISRQLTNSETSAGENALPKFSLPDVSGKEHKISEWEGNVLIINFWATWCPPCLREIPEFITIQTELGSKGLQFIGIAIEEREPVSEYADSIDINYPILIADDFGISLSRQLGNNVEAIPFSIVVDRNGNIIHRHPGEFSREKILEIVGPLL